MARSFANPRADYGLGPNFRAWNPLPCCLAHGGDALCLAGGTLLSERRPGNMSDQPVQGRCSAGHGRLFPGGSTIAKRSGSSGGRDAFAGLKYSGWYFPVRLRHVAGLLIHSSGRGHGLYGCGDITAGVWDDTRTTGRCRRFARNNPVQNGKFRSRIGYYCRNAAGCFKQSKGRVIRFINAPL
jgi:hypothetical protein